jgi:ABC-type antimicrobial peptide transport system permease subunit
VTRLVPSIRTTVAEAVPAGFVRQISTIEQHVQASLVRERLLSILSTFFAGLALTLACIGLYGVMAYRVVRRTREIGIRIAIGARRQSVVWMLVRETLLLVAGGAALGTIAALAASRYISSQLFDVTPGLDTSPRAAPAASIRSSRFATSDASEQRRRSLVAGRWSLVFVGGNWELGVARRRLPLGDVASFGEASPKRFARRRGS